MNRNAHEVTYHRVEPERYVARVDVHCRELPNSRTEARTIYTFVGLSESGNKEIAAMTQNTYDEKMKRWKQWINSHLEGQRQR